MDVTAKGVCSPQKVAKSVTTRDKLKVIFDSYVERTYFNSKNVRFIHRTKSGEWVSLSEGLFCKFLSADGYFKGYLVASKNGKTPDQIKKNAFNKLLHAVILKHTIDWDGELAGIPEGLFVDNGFRCLITRGPYYPVPKEGDCSFIDVLVSQLFPGDQVHRIEALMARMYRQKTDPESVFICQIPILVGEKDCGKSLFKDEIFIPLLGGRFADAISFISGSTFNGELGRADVNVIDDQGFDTRFDQDVVADRLKKFAADRNKRIEAKHQTAINVHSKPAMIILLNTGSKNLRLLPDRTEDIEDKILGFLCGKAVLPKGEEHEKVIQETIRKQLPAYLYKLLHKRQPPAGIESEGRFGIVPFYHPKLLKMREEGDFAIQILEYIDDYIQLNRLGKKWTKTAGQIFRDLADDSVSTRWAFLSLCKTPSALGWQLAKLARIRPKRVKKGKHTKHGIFYTVITETPSSPQAKQVSFM